MSSQMVGKHHSRPVCYVHNRSCLWACDKRLQNQQIYNHISELRRDGSSAERTALLKKPILTADTGLVCNLNSVHESLVV
jgi:hypothetical protein